MRLLWLVVLILLASSVFAQGYLGNTILEGESKTVFVGDRQYEITLVSVSDSQQVALFRVNGEMSKDLKERERYQFSDGSTLYVSHILPNEAGEVGGADLVEFYFMATGGSLAKTPPAPPTTEQGVEYDSLVDFVAGLVGISGEDTRLPQGSFECLTDADCGDSDGCTADACIAGVCHRVEQNGCSFGDSVCVAVNSRMTLNGIPRYCGAKGQWREQVRVGSSCTSNFECTSNLCLGGTCKPVDENGTLVGEPGPGMQDTPATSPATSSQSTVPPATPPLTPAPQPSASGPQTPIKPPATEQPAPVSSPRPSVGGFLRWLLQWLW